MEQSDGKPHSRPWQEVAEEAAREKDPGKLQELSKELVIALDEQSTLCHKDAEAEKQDRLNRRRDQPDAGGG